MSNKVESSADIGPDVVLGSNTSIWHLAQVREGAVLGDNCVIGRGAYIGSGVIVGDNTKIQNYALVYEPARIGAGVFVGPAAVLTNDRFPRAVNIDGSPKSSSDWDAVGVTLLDGCSIGARAVCVAPVTIGRWAMVAAGATVVSDVPDFGLVAGGPARRIGWVGKVGEPLRQDTDEPDMWVCPSTNTRYLQTDDNCLQEM